MVMLPHSLSPIPTERADYLAQVLATQPLQVPVYNWMWLYSHASTSDIYDRLFDMHLEYALKLCFIIAIKNCMNKSTIFLNRRQKVAKVGKKSDFFLLQNISLSNSSKSIHGIQPQSV
jgi:hypothetical protein